MIEVTRHRRQQTRIPRPGPGLTGPGCRQPPPPGPGAASPGRHRPGCHQREVASARELPAPAATSYKPLTVGSIAAPPNWLQSSGCWSASAKHIYYIHIHIWIEQTAEDQGDLKCLQNYLSRGLYAEKFHSGEQSAGINTPQRIK